MNDEEKMKWMFEQIHGIFPGGFELVVEGTTISVLKHGDLSWSIEREELMFDYLTRHLNNK